MLENILIINEYIHECNNPIGMGSNLYDTSEGIPLGTKLSEIKIGKEPIVVDTTSPQENKYTRVRKIIGLIGILGVGAVGYHNKDSLAGIKDYFMDTRIGNKLKDITNTSRVSQIITRLELLKKMKSIIPDSWSRTSLFAPGIVDITEEKRMLKEMMDQMEEKGDIYEKKENTKSNSYVYKRIFKKIVSSETRNEFPLVKIYGAIYNVEKEKEVVIEEEVYYKLEEKNYRETLKNIHKKKVELKEVGIEITEVLKRMIEKKEEKISREEYNRFD